MNKQELIASLDKDKNKFIDAATNIDLDASSRNIACGIFTGIIIAKNHIERLDERIEPQAEKVEVPSMIAKFINENSDPIFEICAWSDHYGSDGRTCDDPELSVVLDWYGSNTKEFYEAVLNGYVVKQGTIYHVLSETKNTYLCDLSIGDAAKRGGWLASFTDDKNKATPFEDREIAEAFATIVSGIVEEN